MKKILFLLLSVLVLTTACSDEPPSIRVKNERDSKANVQFKFGGVNTVNINDVASGQVSAFKEVSEGFCIATAEIQGSNLSPALGFTMIKNRNYTLVVLDGVTPSIRVDDEDK